jgi:hypothetical protein
LTEIPFVEKHCDVYSLSPGRGLVSIYREFSLYIENIFESSLDLTLTEISSVEEDCNCNCNVNYYCIRCLPARGLDLIYRESSLDIENICESSLNLTLTEIFFVDKGYKLLMYSL